MRFILGEKTFVVFGNRCSQFACVAPFITSKLPCSKTNETTSFVCLCLNLNILSAPKPDRVIILHVPANIGQTLVRQKEKRAYIKGGEQDAHERNLSHLKNAESAYLWLAKEFPKNHKV